MALNLYLVFAIVLCILRFEMHCNFLTFVRFLLVVSGSFHK